MSPDSRAALNLGFTNTLSTKYSSVLNVSTRTNTDTWQHYKCSVIINAIIISSFTTLKKTISTMGTCISYLILIPSKMLI